MTTTGTEGSTETSNSWAAPFLADMAQLRSPSPLGLDNPRSCHTWSLPFEDFFFTTGLHVTPAEVQVHSMLFFKGPPTKAVLASTTQYEADIKVVTTVKKAFTDHFFNEPNELYDLARFHLHSQQPDDTVGAFSLRSGQCMVGSCNNPSPDKEEQLVRGRFLVRLLERKFSEKLYWKPKMTLQEATSSGNKKM
ncbi:hypothetical protein HPB51_026505 [Rhipicephalus microplus]|uniref:Uncharacterized protein n=1 Tax=Rhipicephalus microplus TaxID=6941 RepID=A0A9J6D2W2_RHIMP|nr:hypothetical protein HPB51_026505 [Rhipicephalus microplus]